MRRGIAACCVLLMALAVAPMPAAAATRAFSISGRTETELCPAVGTNEFCTTVTPAEGTPWQLPAATRYQSIAFTVRYDHVPGDLTNLFVVLQRRVGGEWQSQWMNGHVAIAQASTLSVSWNLAGYPAGSSLRLAFYAGSDRMAGGVVFFYTGVARTFQASGSVAYT